MGWLDDLLGAGTTEGFVDTAWQAARDFIPTFAPAEDFLKTVGIIPQSVSAPSVQNGGYIPSATEIFSHPLPFAGGSSMGGGASGMWPDQFALTTTGRRGLIPFTGQGPPATGYRLTSRGQRAPQAGRAAGMYWVPRRTMNPLNPRALLRAERRMGAFTKWVKRHFQIQSAMPRRKRSASRGRFTKRRK
jgi:hypothetical protein